MISKNTNRICVFRPAFRCCAQPKAGWNPFLGRFKPFLFISNVLRWFFSWNQEKTLKNIWKSCVLSYSWDKRKCIHLSTKHWKQLKKVIWPAFECAQHPKAGQNTQQIGIKEHTFCLKFPFFNFEIFKYYFQVKSYVLFFSSHWLFRRSYFSNTSSIQTNDHPLIQNVEIIPLQNTTPGLQLP